MPWVRIDEVFPRHPKVVQVGPLGIALQVAALCYCNHYLTDGFVPFRAVRGLLDFNRIGIDASPDDAKVEHWQEIGGLNVARDLVEVGMWDEVPGGFLIHDYADYQPTRAEVEEERARNSKAGKLGAAARQAKRERSVKRGAKQPDKQPAKRDDNASSTHRLAEVQPVPVPGNSSSPKAAAAVTSREERATAASPSQVASGDRSAAEPPDPNPNGQPCRHRNDPATCAICSDTPGTPPPKAQLDAVLGRVRDAAGDDPEATP